MSADYEKIRDENIARYGWDTAVLDLLGQLYSERTHFLFELIQNAEDAGATEVAFDLFDDRLELRHDGRPFTEADVRGVCGVGKSSKSLTAIGQFGIGFKSVYAYTKTPRVYSGDEHFGIERYVRPFAVSPVAVGTGTLFVFPFDLDTVPAAAAAREIAAALNALQPRILLFLRASRGCGSAGWEWLPRSSRAGWTAGPVRPGGSRCPLSAVRRVRRVRGLRGARSGWSGTGRSRGSGGGRSGSRSPSWRYRPGMGGGSPGASRPR